MKHAIRIVAVVACLLAIWMVTRGQSGCAPEPYTAELDLTANDTKYADADVYGSGKLGRLDSQGNKKVTIAWNPLFQGEKLDGVLTIIIRKETGNANPQHHGKHFHVPYEELEKGESRPIDLNNYKVSGQ